MKKIIAIMVTVFLALTVFCAGAESSFLVVAPSGAPAMALSGIWAENPDLVKTINADTIAEAFGSAEADFIIAPINAGAKLFKAGKSTYRLAAVVTWGNLVFASKEENFTPERMNGKRLVLFGENTINASVAKYVLDQKGIVPAEIEFLAGAAETQALLLSSEPDTVVMTAEPAITAAKNKDASIISCPLNDLYREITGFDGFTQAGLFVNAQTAEKDPALVKEALNKIQASVELCAADPGTVAKTVVAMEVLSAEPVALKALPGCNIRWLDAVASRDQIEKTAEIDLQQFGGELPSDDFYFTVE